MKSFSIQQTKKNCKTDEQTIELNWIKIPTKLKYLMKIAPDLCLLISSDLIFLLPTRSLFSSPKSSITRRSAASKMITRKTRQMKHFSKFLLCYFFSISSAFDSLLQPQIPRLSNELYDYKLLIALIKVDFLEYIGWLVNVPLLRLT